MLDLGPGGRSDKKSKPKPKMGPFVPGTEPKNSIQSKWMNDNPKAPVSRQAKSYQPGSPLKTLLDRPEPKVNTQSIQSLLGLSQTTQQVPEMIARPEGTMLQEGARKAQADAKARAAAAAEKQKKAEAEKGKFTIQGGKILYSPDGEAEPTPMVTNAPDLASAAEGFVNRMKRELAMRTDPTPQPKGQVPSEGVKPGKVKPLSWDEYNALGPRAKAAVDFNTMLVAAVNKDKANQETYRKTADAQERAQYEVGVDEMFGQSRGSDLYAPETMAVLQQIKFRDSNADLDDFLGLKAAITEDDLKTIDVEYQGENPLRPGNTTAAKNPLTDAQADRRELVKDLAEGTKAAIDRQMKKAQGVLQDFQSTMYAERSESVGFLGGQADQIKPGPGFGDDELSQMIQTAYTQLTTSDPNTPEIQSMLTDLAKGRRAGDPQAIQFYDYLNTRVQQNKEYGTPLGENVKYRSAEQLAAALGL